MSWLCVSHVRFSGRACERVRSIMARALVLPAEEKVRIALSVLAGEMTVAEAARKAKVWRAVGRDLDRQFLKAGKAGLSAGKSVPRVVRRSSTPRSWT